MKTLFVLNCLLFSVSTFGYAIQSEEIRKGYTEYTITCADGKKYTMKSHGGYSEAEKEAAVRCKDHGGKAKLDQHHSDPALQPVHGGAPQVHSN